MSHVDSGPLATYNSLQDKHLIGYFHNTRMRRHLRRSGLVTRNGEIVTENTFRLNMARREHQKHVRDLMAQAIVHKALDMERHRQAEIKKKLEEISKVELVQRVRTTRGRKGDEDITPYLSPRAPSGRPKSAKQNRPRPVVSGHRPSTAPSKHGGATKKKSAIYVDKEGFPVHRDQAWGASDDGSDEIDSHNLQELDPYVMNNITLNMSPEQKQSNSPYKVDPSLPNPKPSPRAPQGPRKSPRGTSRTVITRDGRRIRPKSNKGSLSLHRKEPAYPHPTQQQTLCDVTVRYRGNNLKLQYEREDKRDEIIVNQQHCGGENLVVFHGLVEPGTDLVFTSHRHRGFPFSLTFYVNQLQVLRLSACCEYKYGPGVMLGGRKGHFKFGRVDGGSPCYRCMVEAELARRERQRYKDTQTEEPKPEPEPEPILENQGTQSDPPPPETRDQVEQSEVGCTYEEEAEAYSDEEFEDEDDKEAGGSETGDSPRAEDKSSDKFFSGPESDEEKKQPDDEDYEDIQDEIPEEEPIKDETQEADDGIKYEVKAEEVPEEHVDSPSVPEEAPPKEDEKDGHQSSRHDDSDSSSDSEGENRVLPSSSSEDEDDEKTRKVKEAVASSYDSSDEEEEEEEEEEEDDGKKKTTQESTTEDKIPFETEKKDEPMEEDIEREHDEDNLDSHSNEDDAKEEDKQSPSPLATKETDNSSAVDSEQELKEDEDTYEKDEDKQKEDEQDEKEEKSFLEKLADKVKDAFTSSDSSSSDSDSDDNKEKKKRKKKKKQKAKSKSGSESEDENKSKTSESDSDKDKKKSFFQKLKDKFTSSDSDSDSDDEKKKKKRKEKSDSENTDVAEKDTSSKDPEQDAGEDSNNDEGDKDEAEQSQEEGSHQTDEVENKAISRDEEQEGIQNDDEEDGKEPGTPPKEKEKEEDKLEKLEGKVSDLFGGSDSDSENDNDKAKEKEEVVEAETVAVPVNRKIEEEPRSLGLQDDDSKIQSDLVEEKEDDQKPEEDAIASPQQEKEADKFEGGDMFGGLDSDSGDDKDQAQVKEDVIKAEEEAETEAVPTTEEEMLIRSSEYQDSSQMQSETDGDDKDDSASLGKYSTQEDNEDGGTQNADDVIKRDEDGEKEDTEAEKKGENKEGDSKETGDSIEQETAVSNQETGAAQQEVETRPGEPTDEDDLTKKTQSDGGSITEEKKDDGSVTSRSSVSDSGSIAGGLYKDFKVLNLNDKNLDESKALKVARALKQPKYHNLEYLLLRGNPLTDSGVATIIRSIIEKHTSADGALNLTHFDLSNSGMADEAATELSKLLKLDTQLCNLNVSENSLSASAWEAIIEGLKVNKALVTFSAEYAHLSDTSCVMLTEGIADHERLEELNIEGNGLGERAGNALAQLVKDNSVITTINLEKDNSISPNILAEVREILETGSYVP